MNVLNKLKRALDTRAFSSSGKQLRKPTLPSMPPIAMSTNV